MNTDVVKALVGSSTLVVEVFDFLRRYSGEMKGLHYIPFHQIFNLADPWVGHGDG